MGAGKISTTTTSRLKLNVHDVIRNAEDALPRNKMIRVLVACEFSGVVRNAFNAMPNIMAISCDLLPPLNNQYRYHYQGPVEDILDKRWDLMIAHPPCTYLALSGVHWLYKRYSRWAKLDEAAAFFKLLLEAPIKHIAVENPVMHQFAQSRIEVKHTHTIQPWQFGHDASKRTCLWLKNLPPLEPTNIILKERYANQTKSKQNNLSPSKTRSLERSITYQGIADAMAQQWSKAL